MPVLPWNLLAAKELFCSPDSGFTSPLVPAALYQKSGKIQVQRLRGAPFESSHREESVDAFQIGWEGFLRKLRGLEKKSKCTDFGDGYLSRICVWGWGKVILWFSTGRFKTLSFDFEANRKKN